MDGVAWSETKADEPGNLNFRHSSGDLYAMVISERITVPTDTLKGVAIANAKKVSPDIKIVEEERRSVNGVDVLMLRLEGTANGVPFVYLGYYYGGAAGTVQVVTYTGQNLFSEYRRKMEDFLNGFRLK
jgi:hypothetical protein